MIFDVKNTMKRREQRNIVKISMDLNPDPPTYMGGDMFQEHYSLTATIGCTFWANKAQLERARAKAEKQLIHFLYKEALTVLVDMELAVEEMDQNELRKACMDLRDIFTGKATQ